MWKLQHKPWFLRCSHMVVLLCNQVLKTLCAAYFTLEPAGTEDTLHHCFLWLLRALQSSYTVYPLILKQMESDILLTQSHAAACIMYRHTVSPLNSSLTPAGWEPPALPVHMKTGDVFFFPSPIWQWSGFILTLHSSQSPESTRHISNVSKICNICFFWETDAVLG